MTLMCSGSGKAFTDDSRLSVLMKRVLRPDDDRDRRLQFVKQLHEFFLVPENYGVRFNCCWLLHTVAMTVVQLHWFALFHCLSCLS